MKIGFVGLGKMGYQIVNKLIKAGHDVVVYDIDSEAVKRLVTVGAVAANSREDLVSQLGSQPIVWLMIPADYVNAEILAFSSILPSGSMLIDGGNTNYTQTIEHAKQLSKKGVELVDVGTSGGILGLKNGFSLMYGGAQATSAKLVPLFEALTVPSGSYAYMGPTGSGHYVKMVHNGIEYGVMQAMAEGYELLKNGPIANIPLGEVADVWQKGSIIESTLNGLVQEIMHENPNLNGVDGYVADSGEGRWTLQAADEVKVDMPVLKDAMAVRKASQNGEISYATKLLAALRNKFGGHAINKQA